MIDVEKKIIHFGYGDIQVGGTWSMLVLTGFEPSVDINSFLTDEVVKKNNIKCVTEPIRINFRDMGELIQFKELIESIDGKDCLQFTYDGYVFDFTNYNELSIRAVLFQIDRIRMYLISLMAC